MAHSPEVTNMALFCDFENIALGVRDAHYDRFDIGRVLERLLLKGSIVVKKAYCDWERYKAFKAPMHEASFELIEIPHVRQSGKNSADIRMVVDALDLCYTKAHVDTFVIISGDSDFSPLVSKLRENAKSVIGVGVKNSTSDLLIANCDEFIYYDDLVREKKKASARRGTPREAGAAKPRAGGRKAAPAAVETLGAAQAAAGGTTGEAAAHAATGGTDAASAGEAAGESARDEAARRDDAVDLVVETVEALLSERGADEKIWGSMVKQALKRVKPGFNEAYYGFRSFNAVLEEAARRNELALDRDEKSGGYIVRLVPGED
ncbi:MAG TPA: NYN domain-containing protein [Casimicrobiaceae bacterium]|nr:NYN domain-containing protein [Casimicrobiaceae bacterium]